MTSKLGFILGVISILVLAYACEQDAAYNPNKDQLTESQLLDLELDSLLTFTSGGEGLSYYLLPQSNDYGNIPQDPNNPLTSKKVELGKLLFHEPGLATSPFEPQGLNTYSCASCHHAGAGFQAGTFQGIGEGGEGFGINGESRYRSKLYNDDLQIDVQPIRSPSIMNVAYQEVMLWGGRMGGTGINAPYSDLWQWTIAPEHFNTFGLEGVETQAIGGLQIHRMEIDDNFINSTGYKQMYDEVFPDYLPIDRYEKFTSGLAIAAYQRTVLANQAPFQRYLQGNSNMLSIEEKKGALLFFGKAGCATCHNSPAFNSMTFHALGMKDLNHRDIINSEPPSGANMNKGRGDFTQNPEEYYQFKVPQLYNLKDSPFYGHGASFTSIRELVEYKVNGVAENPMVPESQLSEYFVPLNLSNEEIDLLVAFIDNALYDPNLRRYEPSELPSGLCFPNNDYASKEDLGC